MAELCTIVKLHQEGSAAIALLSRLVSCVLPFLVMVNKLCLYTPTLQCSGSTYTLAVHLQGCGGAERNCGGKEAELCEG